jgi:hypothetical protein
MGRFVVVVEMLEQVEAEAVEESVPEIHLTLKNDQNQNASIVAETG